MALHPGRPADRPRLRCGDRQQRPPLRQQHRQRPGRQPQAPRQTSKGARRRPPRRTADDPDPRLRPPRQRSRRGTRALGHDDAGAAEPGPEHDLGDVDPARPAGRNPRLRDRKVQRRLQLRRPEADPAGGQGTDRAEGQPRDQRRLPRFRPRRRRDRLRIRRRRPPLLPLQRRRAALRTVFGNQHPARLPEALRQESAGVRALPPYRHRHRPLGPPAELPHRRPPAGLAQRPALRPEPPDRHPHRIHAVRYQRHQLPARTAETRRRLPQRDDQQSPLPGRTGPELRLFLRSSDPRSGRRIPRRSSRRLGRGRGRELRLEAEEGRPQRVEAPEEEAPEEAEGEGGEARRGRPGARARSRRSRGSRGRPQGRWRLPDLLPDPPAPRSHLRRNESLRTRRRPPRLPLQGRQRQPPRGIQNGRRDRRVRRLSLPRRAGDPRLGGSADPQRPHGDRDDSRARIRDLRRQRAGQDGRLAPRRKQLLDRQRPRTVADQRADGRDGALGGRAAAEEEIDEEGRRNP